MKEPECVGSNNKSMIEASPKVKRVLSEVYPLQLEMHPESDLDTFAFSLVGINTVI
jgi:hypothetical protein